MKPFKFLRAENEQDALHKATTYQNARYLAGGTNIVDLMKEHVEAPAVLIDINGLTANKIERIANGPQKGGISIGALNKNAETANHDLIRRHYPLLSQAILAGASAQIRNMATNGGNLMQRTRCTYFYDIHMPCNKRSPGSGCGAINGVNRMHSIVGWSNQCVAVFPSDMCVALAAFDAVIKIQTADGGVRDVKMTDFHALPDDRPEKDNVLEAGELILSIELPKNGFSDHYCYLKVRDRASYAFALVSVGAALEIKDNRIASARVTLGGVAPKPWRAYESEALLVGKPPQEHYFQQAASLALQQAKPLKHNAFKLELARKTIVQALLKSLM